MEKIEYKIGKGKKAITKEIAIKNLNWKEFCKSTDLAIKIQNPNGSQFSDIATFVQLYTGKTEEDMMSWMNACNGQAEFTDEVAIVFYAIAEYIESKKK